MNRLDITLSSMLIIQLMDALELIDIIMYLVPFPLLVVYLLSDKYKKHVRIRKMTRARLT